MQRQSVQPRVKVMRIASPFWFRRDKNRVKKLLVDNILSNRAAIITTVNFSNRSEKRMRNPLGRFH